MADLPPPDDGALRRLDERALPGAPFGGVRPLPPGRPGRGRLPGEAHGLAGPGRRDAGPRGRRPTLPARRAQTRGDPDPDREAPHALPSRSR